MLTSRLLHTADWQIGRQYPRFEPEDAAALSEARFTVVERIARHASQGKFDAILVAGDVFDAQTVSDRTIRRLFNAMQAFDGPWVMIPGNHDAALAESVWSRAARLGVIPANVHVALMPEPVLLHDARIAVLPAPLTQRHTDRDLTAWFDRAQTPSGYFRIGLAHGSVQGILSEDIESANPIAPDRADSARLDYLALGDWHGMRSINDHTWYSGAPETDRFRNNESGHILEITLDTTAIRPQVNPLRIGQYTWDSRAMDLTVASDIELVLHYLQGLSENHVVELGLRGRIDLADQARLNDGLGAAEARARVLEPDMTDLRLHPTDDDIAALKADGYLAEVLRTLQDMQEPDSAGHADRPDPGARLQGGETSQPDARVARDALALLASIMQQDQA